MSYISSPTSQDQEKEGEDEKTSYKELYTYFIYM